jgi:hypothetical protein
MDDDCEWGGILGFAVPSLTYGPAGISNAYILFDVTMELNGMGRALLMICILFLFGCSADWKAAREKEYMDASTILLSEERAISISTDYIEKRELGWNTLIGISIHNYDYHLVYDTPSREMPLLGPRVIRVDGKSGVAEELPRY